MFTSKENVQSLLGILACLVTSVSADGRVFVLDQRNFSGPHGFRDAQQACASQQARLAAVEELRHAVVECFFSQCTRGWLYGGAVGATVCNIEGSSLKTVNVRIENATEDSAHVSAFCIKDKVVACGDPPSFPNARLQEHSGFEMGDELLYTCVPGYVMPSGLAAFSLLCDSCGEWYGSVQICIKDNTESHVDYEDKFEDSYGQAARDHDSSEKDHDDSFEEVFGGTSQDEKRSLQQQETGFRIKVEENQDLHKGRDIGGMVINNRRVFQGAVEEVAKNVEQHQSTVHPKWEQERSEVVGTDASVTTEEPVSLLSQKHLFWFPSEAFQEGGPPFSTDSVTRTTQRASGGSQSQESKENESQERHHISNPVDVDNHDDEQDRFDDHDNSRHDDDEDDHEDDHTNDPDDNDSHHEDDDVKHQGKPDDFDRRDHSKDHDDHDDHYDMGEHEKDRDRVRYGSREYDDRDDAYIEHHSHEDHDDATDDRRDKDVEDPDVSEEHPEHDDHDGDDDDDDDHDLVDHDTHEDHNDKYDDHYDDHDSHEDDDDGRMHVIFSVATGGRSNITQGGTGSKTTKDETWLDGYPVQEPENGDSTRKPIRPVDGESVVKTTDKPNEVELRRRVPHTSSTDKHDFPSMAPDLDQGVVEKVRPGFRTPGTSPDHLQHSDAPSFSDTLDYDTQQAAPTHSWLDELTEHPFLDHGPAPPMHDGDFFPGVMGEHTVHNLPGEMGEVEGEMGETICVGEDCPSHPPNSASRGPTVAAIIVVVCAVIMAVIFGVWCYRRQQQKSSVYEMNEKGQSQTRPGQQIEMQPKV